MTLHAASREALETAETRLDEVLGESGVDSSAVGTDLFSVADLLTGEVGLRRAVGDGSSDPEARKRLVWTLLDGKVSEPALKVLATAVASRWSSPRELVDGVASLGRSALLTSAVKADKLDTVEGELFQAARILEAEPELERALSDRAAPAAAKRKLVRSVFGGSADAVTVSLVEQAVLHPTGRGAAYAVDELVTLAAARRERSVAHVRSAAELTAEQREALAARLGQLYGRQIALHVELDPEIGAGLIVRVGDEVIDGSAQGRLEALRRQLA